MASQTRSPAQHPRGQVVDQPRSTSARVPSVVPLSDPSSMGPSKTSEKVEQVARNTPAHLSSASPPSVQEIDSEVKRALYDLCRESRYSRAEVAGFAGQSKGNLERQLDPEDSHRVALSQAVAIAARTGDRRLLDLAAGHAGCVLVPLPAVDPGPEGLALALGDVEAELGEVWADYRDARRGGSEAGADLSAAERARLSTQLDDVIRCAVAARMLLGGVR